MKRNQSEITLAPKSEQQKSYTYFPLGRFRVQVKFLVLAPTFENEAQVYLFLLLLRLYYPRQFLRFFSQSHFMSNELYAKRRLYFFRVCMKSNCVRARGDPIRRVIPQFSLIYISLFITDILKFIVQ